MHTDETNDRFPTLQIIALMVVVLITAFISNSIVMLVSALLPTPLLLWRLFVVLDEWETSRAMKAAPKSPDPTNANGPTATLNPTTERP